MNEEFYMNELIADQNTQAEQPFDKERWRQEKNQEKQEAYELIDTIASSVSNDDTLLSDYLLLSARFPNLSAANILLLLGQNPQATELKSYEQWKALGIYVKKGEQALLSIEKTSEYIRTSDGSTANNFAIRHLFDITQTSAKQKVLEQIDQVALIKSMIASSPVPITLSDEIPNDQKCYYDPLKGRILIARMTEKNEIFTSLCNEIAHAKLGYQNHHTYERDQYQSRAKCVTHILANRYDFDHNFEEYDRLDMFSDCDTVIAKRDVLNELTRTANSITYAIDKEQKSKNAAIKDAR